MADPVRNFGKVFASMWIWIFLLYVFLPLANFKLVKALVADFGNGITYYDLATPLFIIVMIAEVMVWIVKPRFNAP